MPSTNFCNKGKSEFECFASDIQKEDNVAVNNICEATGYAKMASSIGLVAGGIVSFLGGTILIGGHPIASSLFLIPGGLAMLGGHEVLRMSNNVDEIIRSKESRIKYTKDVDTLVDKFFSKTWIVDFVASSWLKTRLSLKQRTCFCNMCHGN